MIMPAPRDQDTILPDILDVASEHGVHLGKTLRNRPDETRACCPFCEDSKFHLYLNSAKQTFRCYRCGESGGVIGFISKLTNTSEYAILEELKKMVRENRNLSKTRKPKLQTHPGIRLNVFQLRQIGYECRPVWKKFFQEEPVLAQQYADAIWEKWQRFIEFEQIYAMRMLLMSLYTGTYNTGVERIRSRSEEIGYDLLTPCLIEYSKRQPPQWVIKAACQAVSWMLAALEREIDKELERIESIKK